MTVTDIVLLALAAGQLVQIWLHEGLFTDLRDWIIVHLETPEWEQPTDKEWADARTLPPLQSQAKVTPPPYKWQNWVGDKLAFLVNCEFCLTVWAVIGLGCLMLLAPSPWSQIPIWLLAAMRIAAITYRFTPRSM